VLEENRPEWQRLVGKKLKTKFTPQLKFQFDGSIERGDRVMEIMREIEQENAARNKQNGAS
jgi:ribosome-binding factor A